MNKVLDYLRENGKTSSKELYENINAGEQTIRENLKALRKRWKKIKKVGETKNRFFIYDLK